MMSKCFDAGGEGLRWLLRTPVQTFVLCPLAVIVAEFVLRGGKLVFVPWGCVLLAWGYLQYLLVGNYRLPLAGGGRGMECPPTASSKPALTVTRAIRCTSAISFS
jgi:hypothetical protein